VTRDSKRCRPTKPEVSFDYSEWEKCFKRSACLSRTWEKLTNLGCSASCLVDLVIPCVRYDWESSYRKRDLDEVKRRFDGIAKRLRSLAIEAETLGKTPIRHMNGMPLADCLAMPSALRIVRGIDPPADFFLAWPAELRDCAARLDELRKTLTTAWPIRQSSGTLYAFILYSYCREATHGKATYAEVADLLNAGFEANHVDRIVDEDGLRMQLRRLNRSQTQHLRQQLQLLMKQFVSSGTAEGTNFNQWALSRNSTPGAVEFNSSPAKTGVYELLSKKSEQAARLLEFVGTEPDSPQDLEQEIASLISALRGR
jgi:hypothetical protein